MPSQSGGQLPLPSPITFLQATPLPPNPFSPTQLHWNSAYQKCLEFQEVSSTPMDLILSRLLGYLLIEAPYEQSRDFVATEILECKANDEKLSELGLDYKNHLMQIFRQNRTKTPATSLHPSRHSFENQRSLISTDILPPPASHLDAKKAALCRDNYQCLASRSYDTKYLLELRQSGLTPPYCAVPPIITNAAHIFPPSANKNLNEEDTQDKTSWAETVWAQIKNYGRIDVLKELNGPEIHRLGNVLTLAVHMHNYFDSLLLWFEEDEHRVSTDTHHHYVLHAPWDVILQGLDRRVTFSNADPINKFELPNRRYLKLHAAVCRVAHLSGAAEYLEKYDRDHEEGTVLANDGSSADWLEMRLHRAIAQPTSVFG